MQRFKCTWTEHYSCEAIIEAENEDEAIQIAAKDLSSKSVISGPTSEYHSTDDLEAWNIDDNPEE